MRLSAFGPVEARGKRSPAAHVHRCSLPVRRGFRIWGAAGIWDNTASRQDQGRQICRVPTDSRARSDTDNQEEEDEEEDENESRARSMCNVVMSTGTI